MVAPNTYNGTPAAILMSSTDAYEEVKMLRSQLASIERRYSELDKRFEQVVEVQDLLFRTLRNQKMSAVYQKLYIALVDLYPALLDGTAMEINAWKVRENAGWVSKESATKFFQDMQSIGVFSYNPGAYNAKENERTGHLTPAPDVFPYPENFDTRSAEKRKKARADEQKKRDKYREAVLILQCDACGSPNIRYGLHPKCGSCGHVHAPAQDIAVERISIVPDESEQDFEEWLGMGVPEPEPVVTPVKKNRTAPTPTPRCQHWKCATGPQRIERRALGLYCTGHNGYIDEKGRIV